MDRGATAGSVAAHSPGEMCCADRFPGRSQATGCYGMSPESPRSVSASRKAAREEMPNLGKIR